MDQIVPKFATQAGPDFARRRLLAAAGLAPAVVLASGWLRPARADASDANEVLQHSIGTLQDLRRDKEFGNARALIHRSSGVLIAPRIFKAGFFFGGEGGQAVLLARTAHGWSDPAFFDVGSASFGLQIGAQEAEMVMIIMNPKALQSFLQSEFKLGANAGIAVATLGSTSEAASTTNVGADIIVWASASGAYAGISLDGTVIKPNNSNTTAFYGNAYSPEQIFHAEPKAAGAGGIRHAMASI